MSQILHYHFERRSKNHLDWMANIIKSENYFLADSIIITNRQMNQFNGNLKSA